MASGSLTDQRRVRRRGSSTSHACDSSLLRRVELATPRSARFTRRQLMRSRNNVDRRWTNVRRGGSKSGRWCYSGGRGTGCGAGSRMSFGRRRCGPKTAEATTGTAVTSPPTIDAPVGTTVEGVAATEAPVEPAATGSYVVVAGDSLSAIAGAAGVSLDALVAANGWSDGAAHLIQPSDVIVLPPGASAPGPQPTAAITIASPGTGAPTTAVPASGAGTGGYHEVGPEWLLPLAEDGASHPIDDPLADGVYYATSYAMTARRRGGRVRAGTVLRRGGVHCHAGHQAEPSTRLAAPADR